MKQEISVSCRGCHGGCMHLVTVEDGRVVSLRPDPDGPLNHGHGCMKGMSLIEQMYHPDRLLYPMRRKGGRGSGAWERISWDEAYDEIAEKMGALIREHGPECVTMLSGTGRHHLAHFWRFASVLGTPNATDIGALVCLGPRVNAGMMTAGVFAGVDYYGDKRPGGILVWGANPAVSGADGELQWHIRDAAKAGTPLIVVDPRPTELAQKAEIWLRLRPGTDGLLALAILNVLIGEELYDRDFVEKYCYGFAELRERVRDYSPERAAELCWVPAEQIRRAARRIAQIKPLSLEWGCAIEQSVNAIQTCRAVYMIPALTGNWDVPGGFVASQDIAPVAPSLSERLTPEILNKRMSGGYAQLSVMNMAHPYLALDAMKTGKPVKIRGAFCNANNALLSMADSRHTYECLRELDFFVCMDIFMTPTAELADIVLPAALWPELDELYCMPEFGDEAVLCQKKLVQVGECKSDEDFFFELSKRMGLDYGADSVEAVYDWQLSEMGRRRPEYAGIDFKKFKGLSYIQPKRKYFNYKNVGFRTPTGKFELWSKPLEAMGSDPLPFWTEVPESPYSQPRLAKEYPLVLTTGSRLQQYFISNNRQIKSLRRTRPFPTVSMAPETAAKHGLSDGDWVWIETARGRITQKLKTEPGLDPRVVNCEMGWWYPEAGAPDYGWDESNANILTVGDAPRDPTVGAYQLRALLCRVSKNEHCAIEKRYWDWMGQEPVSQDLGSLSVVLDPSKCILCGNCVYTCAMTQKVGALEIVSDGKKTRIAPVNGAASLAETDCTGCGQCTAVCPAGALRVRSAAEQVKAAVADPKTRVAAQIAPAVRVSLNALFHLPKGNNSIAQLRAALLDYGFDEVYDTTQTADLTVLEEGRELLARLTSGEKLPLLTSCCPAWVRYCEARFPELVQNISTCRSPHQMFGAVLKELARETPADGRKTVVVSIMPCTAKKTEITRPDNMTDGQQDVDIVLTASELETLLAGWLPAQAAPAEELGAEGSGGGVLFGASGGVLEAVLRYLGARDDVASAVAVGEAESVKELTVELNGRTVRAAILSGLGNAEKLLRSVLAGEADYDVIEVMACPGGCVMGGGQPKQREDECWEIERNSRTGGLLQSDAAASVKRADQNETVLALYDGVLKGKEHKLLHRAL